jgi:AraC family transcriptional regulator
METALPQAIGIRGRVSSRDPYAVVTSRVLDWPGVLIETGTNNIAEVDDFVMSRHYLTMNASDKPYTYEIKGPYGFQSVTVRPGEMCLSPARDSVTLRMDSTHRYVRTWLDPAALERLINSGEADRPVRLRSTVVLNAVEIASLLNVLVVEAKLQNPGGLAVVQAVSSALVHLLLRKVGVDPPKQNFSRGGLSPSARRRALEMMDSRLGARLTIDTLAHEVGLSPAHFARAFKTTFGSAPHQYLLALRLEKARRELEAPGANLSAVAQHWGFADQAHFTRLFKRTFGLTPGTLVRQQHNSSKLRA